MFPADADMYIWPVPGAEFGIAATMSLDQFRCRRRDRVGALYKLKVSIEEKIKADGLDPMQVKGVIGLRTGRLLSLISVSTPDDPVIMAKMRQAAKEVLNLSL